MFLYIYKTMLHDVFCAFVHLQSYVARCVLCLCTFTKLCCTMCFVLLYIYKAMLHDVFYAFVHVQSYVARCVLCLCTCTKLRKQFNLLFCNCTKDKKTNEFIPLHGYKMFCLLNRHFLSICWSLSSLRWIL